MFVGEDTEKLKKAKLVTPEDVDKFKWKGADAKNSQEATIATEVKSVPDSSKRHITYAQNSALLEVFDDLVKQSTYLRDAMTTLYTTSLTPDKDKKDDKVNNPGGGSAIGWYHVTSELSKAVWDPTTSDWSYHTRYVFETYQTPVITASYVNPGMNYYGPHKRYDYWYTGKNSEVLKYEQVLDNLYYNVVLGKTVAEANADKDASASTGGDTDTAVIPGQNAEGPKLGKLGKGNEAQNSYVTSLYSPADYGSASVTILGDPDFIVQDQTSSVEDVYNRFYGSTGFNVNANGGQVFMEINFKEAIDYDEGTGVLELNDNILFWLSCSKRFAKEGYAVLIIDANKEAGEQELKSLKSDGYNADGNDEREGNNTEQGSSSGANAGDGNSTTGSNAGLRNQNVGDNAQAAGSDGTSGSANPNDDNNDAETTTEDNGGRE